VQLGRGVCSPDGPGRVHSKPRQPHVSGPWTEAGPVAGVNFFHLFRIIVIFKQFRICSKLHRKLNSSQKFMK
jgi:hypothetical protein